MNKYIQCTECGGTDETEDGLCEVCNGTGEVWQESHRYRPGCFCESCTYYGEQIADERREERDR